ncbi:MAG TPA: ATP-dependent RecD-like DNA helicase [Baekduia sp.]|nr:ATP-dependent RecD-like DNA helicase [Baekduia sp.]
MASPEIASLNVEIVAVRFRTDDGQFAVLAAVTDEGDEVTLTGAVGHVNAGESAAVQGQWRTHPKHGRQLHCERVKLSPPSSEAALAAYLSAVKHIGPKGAQWLVDHHGADAVLDAIDADPGKALGAVPGIGRSKLPAAVRSWEDQVEVRAVRLFLEQHGVPAAAAARIHRAYGAGSIELLQEDPYSLTELDGVGFSTADDLARALGVPVDAPERLDAGIVHALQLAESDGHCSLPRAELTARAAKLLEVPGDMISDRLSSQVGLGKLVADGDVLVEPAMDATERALAKATRALLDDEPQIELDVPDTPAAAPGAPTEAQWAAIRAVSEHRLAILTGLPGTGKTATMKALVTLATAQGLAVRLCAPTGKAARRLAETTGQDATTIHRLLEYTPGEGFVRDADDPVLGADILIADEASMLDVRLAKALLCAIGPKTHVLLIGDVDQLAPVGPGRVLDDLIESGAVPVIRLTEIFRQAARSLIVRAAHAINRGELPPAKAAEDDVRDFFVIERDGAAAIFDEVVSLAAERLPKHYGLDAAAGVQVLTPMHRGPAGIDALNDSLRARLNPHGRPIDGLALRVGDRVVQSKNDHDALLMNGQTAVVLNHDDEADKLMLAVDDGRTLALPIGSAHTLRLAYAMSIHKSQGSQAPAIVVVMHRGHHVMLTRSLLYTAITRAEQVCVVVGETQALSVAVSTLDARRRHTRLARLVGEPMPA